MLRLPDRWVWDWWLADTGAEYHLFYLQAPRALGDQHLRHRNASIGHAVSTDLREWTVLRDALGPGEPGAWDDLAIWTGSVVRHDDHWGLFYTGVSRADDGLVQRVGLAMSTDLLAWRKHAANPLLVLDPRWYETLDSGAWHDQAWRDPWVLADPNGDGWHALLTARSVDGAPDARGVIGHAWSADLVRWEARPPLTSPGEFGHMEVPQVAVVEGTPVLVFSSSSQTTSHVRRTRRPNEGSGSFLAIGETLLGPWDIAGARRIPVPDLYSARLVEDRGGEWQVMGFLDGSERGAFRGELSDPIPLRDLWLL